MYEMTKHLHLTFMLLSVLLFLTRFVLTLNASPILQKKALKIAPHIIDTFGLLLLLASA